MPAVEAQKRLAFKGRVYVADDDWSTKDLFVNLLEDAHWQVVGSTCYSDEAIKDILASNVDVAILDIRFASGPDGIAIASTIRDRTDTEVIFITGHGDEETHAMSESLGAAGYLDKPINSLEALEPFLTNAIERRQFVAANRERLALIDRRSKQGLSVDESTRLEVLQQKTSTYLDRHHPPDGAVVDRILSRARQVLE